MKNHFSARHRPSWLRGPPRSAVMPQLYMLTVPGLEVKSDWSAVHDRLLDDYPDITDVLPTTMAATLLIAYEGAADIDGWLHGVEEAILSRRPNAARRRSA